VSTSHDELKRARSSAAEISAVMRRVKSRDTTPERVFRAAVRKQGLKFRSCDRGLPGVPDFSFGLNKLAVFIDGDLLARQSVAAAGPTVS
jgi:DNA mismatch endonuclease Vsr